MVLSNPMPPLHFALQIISLPAKENILQLLMCSLSLTLQRNVFDHNLPSSTASLLYATEISDLGRNENLIEGWDLIEHPTFPPPPSQTEDVEHWTRAMFIDATKK